MCNCVAYLYLIIWGMYADRVVSFEMILFIYFVKLLYNLVGIFFCYLYTCHCKCLLVVTERLVVTEKVLS